MDNAVAVACQHTHMRSGVWSKLKCRAFGLVVAFDQVSHLVPFSRAWTSEFNEFNNACTYVFTPKMHGSWKATAPHRWVLYKDVLGSHLWISDSQLTDWCKMWTGSAVGQGEMTKRGNSLVGLPHSAKGNWVLGVYISACITARITGYSVARFKTEKVPRKIMKFPEPFPTISKVWEFSQNCFSWHFY